MGCGCVAFKRRCHSDDRQTAAVHSSQGQQTTGTCQEQGKKREMICMHGTDTQLLEPTRPTHSPSTCCCLPFATSRYFTYILLFEILSIVSSHERVRFTTSSKKQYTTLTLLLLPASCSCTRTRAHERVVSFPSPPHPRRVPGYWGKNPHIYILAIWGLFETLLFGGSSDGRKN